MRPLLANCLCCHACTGRPRPPWITELPTPLGVWTAGEYAGASVTHRSPAWSLRPDALTLARDSGLPRPYGLCPVAPPPDSPNPGSGDISTLLKRGHFNFALTALSEVSDPERET